MSTSVVTMMEGDSNGHALLNPDNVNKYSGSLLLACYRETDGEWSTSHGDNVKNQRIIMV